MVVLCGRVSVSGNPETVLCLVPNIGIGIGKGDDGLTAFEQFAGILTDVYVPFKPGHVPMLSICELAEEGIEVGRPLRSGKANGNETQALGK